MSTPAVYGLKKNGIIKSSYCHGEGWLDSLGKSILNEFKDIGETYLSKLFDKIVLVDGETNPTNEEIKYFKDNNWYNGPVACFSSEFTWYDLLRDIQGSFEPLIKVVNNVSKKAYMVYSPIDSQNFGYLIDLDEKQFVYFKDKKIVQKLSFELIEQLPVNAIIDLLEKKSMEGNVKNTPTNLGKTREEIIYELLLSINQGNVGYLTNDDGYMPKINVAIGQYDALVKKGIIREI